MYNEKILWYIPKIDLEKEKTMAACEFRYGSSITTKSSKEGNMSVAVSGDRPICFVKVIEDPIDPVCELPALTTETCPIARYKQGSISFNNCNQELNEIFAARKAERASRIKQSESE